MGNMIAAHGPQTYTGPATLAIPGEPDPITLDVDLHIEAEPHGPGVLRQWAGTGTPGTTGFPVPTSQCILTIPGKGHGGVYVLEADDVLELQGVGAAPWWV